MLSEPQYTDISDTVTLILTNKVSKHKKTIAKDIMRNITSDWATYNDTERLILQCLFTQFTPTVSELAKYCHVSEKAIRGYINNFIAKNMVIRLSEKQRDKSARYSFKKAQ